MELQGLLWWNAVCAWTQKVAELVDMQSITHSKVRCSPFINLVVQVAL